MTGHLQVPEGTILSENNQEFILPTGQVLKVWEVVEDHTLGEDLSQMQLNDLGVFTDLEFDREMELMP